MKIGDTLWSYDQWARPDHRWRAHTIIGETNRSWVIDRDGWRIDKKTLTSTHGQLYDADGKADREYADTYGGRITEAVKAAWLRADTATLRAVAALLGIE